MEIKDIPENQSEAFGLEVDEFFGAPPAGLKVASFVMRLGDDGQMDEELLDTIIEFSLSDVDCILDVSHDLDFEASMGDEDLLTMANNIGVHISFLPPAPADGEEAMVAYIKRLERFAAPYLSKKNFKQFVFPHSAHLEYLFSRVLAKSDDDLSHILHPEDAYIHYAFLSRFDDQAVQDRMKGALEESLLAFYGGKEGFDHFARQLFYAIHDGVKGQIQRDIDIQEQMLADKARDEARAAEEQEAHDDESSSRADEQKTDDSISDGESSQDPSYDASTRS